MGRECVAPKNSTTLKQPKLSTPDNRPVPNLEGE